MAFSTHGWGCIQRTLWMCPVIPVADKFIIKYVCLFAFCWAGCCSKFMVSHISWWLNRVSNISALHGIATNSFMKMKHSRFSAIKLIMPVAHSNNAVHFIRIKCWPSRHSLSIQFSISKPPNRWQYKKQRSAFAVHSAGAPLLNNVNNVIIMRLCAAARRESTMAFCRAFYGCWSQRSPIEFLFIQISWFLAFMNVRISYMSGLQHSTVINAYGR